MQSRAQFDSFEQAQERVRVWVRFYNHRRPHQFLEGLCPADRFFALAPQLRAVIERGIADAKAGRVMSVDAAFKRLRSDLGLLVRKVRAR